MRIDLGHTAKIIMSYRHLHQPLPLGEQRTSGVARVCVCGVCGAKRKEAGIKDPGAGTVDDRSRNPVMLTLLALLTSLTFKMFFHACALNRDLHRGLRSRIGDRGSEWIGDRDRGRKESRYVY